MLRYIVLVFLIWSLKDHLMCFTVNTVFMSKQKGTLACRLGVALIDGIKAAYLHLEEDESGQNYPGSKYRVLW